MNITKLLEFEEGFRSTPYYCSAGFPTIGIGWRIGGKNQPLEDFRWMEMSEEAALAQCKSEVNDLAINLHCVINCWQELNEPRQAVLISMAYQMGISGLMKFEKMLAAIESKCWNDASAEGLNSKWARQTPERAKRQMEVLFSGDWSEYE